jgi:UDP-glucuronate 4-epimerase
VKVLVTGCAGFIGYHVAEALLARGDSVVGVDSLNDYYDVRLKQARLDRLRARSGFGFHHLDVSDKDAVGALVADHGDIAGIVHLAAQAGVRHSLVDPYAYVQANVMGHLVVLEAARQHVVGLWVQHRDAVPRDGSGGSAGVAVCRDQAGR